MPLEADDLPGCYYLEAWIPPGTYDSVQLETRILAAPVNYRINHGAITLVDFRRI